ncbi:hypothetical protein [Pseudomonas sp. SCB32]|uniref:hypothetical protein n=1 Tax=Pseudomonas sp. SCB32 TaxID=2653853 RepID=UPI00211436C7|nr:hypothetical protein [Pseudomonas sp. SCB32]
MTTISITSSPGATAACSLRPRPATRTARPITASPGKALDTGASGSLWSGVGLRDGRLLLVGMSGRVLLGEHWQALDSGSHEAITAVAQLSDGRVALVGNGGLVALSDSSLERFTVAQREDRLSLSSLAPRAYGHLLLFGTQGVIAQ